ncbi:hypothetical protein B0537_02620 [Desulforamulus ferrireducens]|uniref:Uncharacterized protein n=1 Tax=Desulforamulus ferrireducens TaxID=1833852 RepID=A0A1S6ITI9_9FIRM|nr:hypothetical protein B0537_02620 [Desulforamulus ferrireducens]
MPGMGDSFRVKVPNRGWQHQLLAKSKGVHREVESERSWRQIPDLRYTNHIRGCYIRARLPDKSKPYVAKGYSSKCGRYMG